MLETMKIKCIKAKEKKNQAMILFLVKMPFKSKIKTFSNIKRVEIIYCQQNCLKMFNGIFFSDKKKTIAGGELYTDNLIFGYSSCNGMCISDSPMFLESTPSPISHLVGPELNVYCSMPQGF